jgi:hypothetical protein
MLNLQLPNTFGVFLVLELFAVPFGCEGAAALMEKQWAKGIIAYLIATPLAAGGLIVLGVPLLGHQLTPSVEGALFAWLKPLANPFILAAVLIGILFWIRTDSRSASRQMVQTDKSTMLLVSSPQERDVTPVSMPVLPLPLEKSIIDIQPEELTRFFEGRLDINAGELVQPYIGKWTIVEGILRTVGHPSLFIQVTLEDRDVLYIYFESSWAKRLATLRPKMKIRVLGQIGRVRRFAIDLENCELLDDQL